MAIIELPVKAMEELYRDKDTRVGFVRDSFFHFITIYLQHRFELDPADFHKEMIDALDSVDDLDKYLAIIGFRGSAKSTILEAFALWSMLNGKHNFIVYVGATIDDAQMSLANIRDEVEQNVELREDFNIILDDSKQHGFREKWSESQITINDCTIIAKSRGQKIRGAKFKKARIDLIIGDDLEDVKDADTMEKRQKTRQWFFTEMLPATKQGVQSDNVKVVLIGNLVHRDCLLAHLSKGEIVKTLRFALLDENGKITWKGLYPDMEAVEKEKQKVLLAGEGMGHVIWAREYLLQDADAEEMILTKDDIQYYPDEWLQRRAEASGTGVDFAISQKQTADYTAMVSGQDVKNDEGERRLLIMKRPLNKRMNFEETIQTAVDINSIMPHGHKWYPEKVAYQQAAIEIMEKNGLTCIPMPAVTDKRSRAVAACFYVKNGRVLFPKEGAENLIDALLGFGVEAHDDLVDAFSNVVLGMVKRGGGILLG